mgnify:CR=1 FL=1
MALKPVSVTQLNEYISRVLTTDPLLGNIRVTGEITNLKYHSTGHVYFSIADENSKINCFFPVSYVKNLRIKLYDGLKVIINGYINVYKKGGTYTLFVRSIESCGEGDLAAAFELLKKKLDAEGLFAQEHKKPIPAFPRKIGIVTSETGAALQDILKIIKGRTSLVDILIFPVLVQGPDAAADIASALDRINETFHDIDTLIVGRGGGSAEDLWPFNEECVARAIYRSRIPVISAVGHEIDFTIADMAADLRAETPTKGAVLAVPDTGELREQLEKAGQVLSWQLQGRLQNARLSAVEQEQRLRQGMHSRLQDARRELEKYKTVLESHHPGSILDQGYAMVQTMDGRVISDVRSLELSDLSAMDQGVRYRLTLKNGTAEIAVLSRSVSEPE